MIELHEVDPDRLAYGKWCHKRNRQIGEGDSAASYSADRIAYGEPIRKPFEWNGALWVCVGLGMNDGIHSAKAYRLVAPEQFEGHAQTYTHRTRDSEAARNDPSGFHHGIILTCRGQTLVLCGPPVCFVPGPKQQLDLFDMD